MKYTKKKPSFFKRRPVISTILIAIILFAVMFLDNYPSLQPMRDSWLFILISKTLISGAVLYFAWLSNKKPPVFERMILSVFALLPWVALLLQSYRMILLLQMAIFLVLFVLFTKHFLTDKKYNVVTITVTLFLGMIYIQSVKDYTYLHHSGGIHFWQISLIAAVIITFAFTVFLIKGKIQLKDDRISEKIAAPILVLGMSFIFIAFTISNLNYALDSSKPVDFASTILEKRIDSGYRRSTNYIFTANVDGEEKEFNVDQSEYYHKKVGDSFVVQLYLGAFGHEYYIYDYSK